MEVAVSNGCLDSRFAASTASAPVLHQRKVAPRIGFPPADLVRPDYHPEQPKRITSLPDVLSEYEGRTAVGKFATEPSPELLKSDPLQVLQKHEIPRRYFYLPNQFWRHKYHKIVLAALALLSERGVRPVVIASGGSDPNEPEYLIG